jgi:hypothetical protein
MAPVDTEGAAIVEIDAAFARQIAGLRRLPASERPHALRAAQEARRQALRALREKRALRRQADYLLRKRLRGPAPR